MKLYLSMFGVFSRIGLFTLGGGYAMVPLIEREVVDKKHWLGEEEFLDALAIAQSLPGPIAVNTSVFVGYKLRGMLGSIVCSLGTVMPSFVCMVIIAAFFTGIKDHPTVASVFTGIRPAVAALIAASVWSLGKKAKLNWKTVSLMLAVALVVAVGKISPALVVAVLAVVGVFFPVAAVAKAAETSGSRRMEGLAADQDAGAKAEEGDKDA